MRSLLHRFAVEGMAAKREQPRSVRLDRARRQVIEVALDWLLQQRQVWDSATLAVALAAEENIQAAHRVQVPAGQGALW